MSLLSNDPRKDQHRVTFFLVISGAVLLGLVSYAQDHNYFGSIHHHSLCAQMDSWFQNIGHTGAVLICLGTAALACIAAKFLTSVSWPTDVLNIILFAEITVYAAWRTASTGGLYESIYSSILLCLFPVALIAPKENWVKMICAAIVAGVSFIVARISMEASRDTFILVSSVVGCCLAYISHGVWRFFKEAN